MAAVYNEIFQPIEEIIASEQQQDFPTLDTTPQYSEHEFLSM
jgi:hypothetical protein